MLEAHWAPRLHLRVLPWSCCVPCGDLHSAAPLPWLWACGNASSHRGKRIFVHLFLIMILHLILLFRKSSFIAHLNQMFSLFPYNVQYIIKKNCTQKKISSCLTQKKKTWKRPNKSTLFLILSFCDCYAKLSRFNLSLLYPISHFLFAFFLCCSVSSLYKWKMKDFSLIHVILEIKINSKFLSVLLFLHPCRQQHLLLFRFSVIQFASASMIFSLHTFLRLMRKTGDTF